MVGGGCNGYDGLCPPWWQCGAAHLLKKYKKCRHLYRCMYFRFSVMSLHFTDNGAGTWQWSCFLISGLQWPPRLFAQFPLKNSWFRLILSETYSFISSCVFLIGTSALLPRYRGTTGSNPAWPSACRDFWTGCWWSNDFFDAPAFFSPPASSLRGPF